MKVSTLLIPLLLSAAVSVHGGVNPSRKTTIKEYYYLLPPDALPADLQDAESRRAALARKPNGDERPGLIADDPRNGYLSLGYQSRSQNVLYELAVWRGADGVDIIGINELYAWAGSLNGKTRFFAQRGGVWRNVTPEVFADFKPEAFLPTGRKPTAAEGVPQINLAEGFSCRLPRVGLAVVCRFTLNRETETAYSEKDFFRKPVVTFSWTGTRFAAR